MRPVVCRRSGSADRSSSRPHRNQGLPEEISSLNEALENCPAAGNSKELTQLLKLDETLNQNRYLEENLMPLELPEEYRKEMAALADDSRLPGSKRDYEIKLAYIKQKRRRALRTGKARKVGWKELTSV